MVALADAATRTLAEPIVARADIPPFANSAMDGFVVAPGPAERRLRIAGEARAGHPLAAPAHLGEAIRISTGAPVPAGGEAVVPIERVREDDGWITLTATVAAGDHVRGAGEDVCAGATAAAPGTVLGAVELGIAAASGNAQLACAPRPRVAVVVTGDELIGAGEPLGPGQIHDSNAIMLATAARRAGADASRLATIGDDRKATEQGLAAALEGADVLVVSGGVSVGPHDHVKGALAQLDVEERFWRVALKPGKPTWFGTRGAQLVFGLPGNPVSAYVCFALFVAPALRAMLGRSALPQRGLARLGAAVAAAPAREQAIGARIEHGPTGTTAWPVGQQGSHRLSSLLGAEVLVFLPASARETAAGAEVEFEPLPR